MLRRRWVQQHEAAFRRAKLCLKMKESIILKTTMTLQEQRRQKRATVEPFTKMYKRESPAGDLGQGLNPQTQGREGGENRPGGGTYTYNQPTSSERALVGSTGHSAGADGTSATREQEHSVTCSCPTSCTKDTTCPGNHA